MRRSDRTTGLHRYLFRGTTIDLKALTSGTTPPKEQKIHRINSPSSEEARKLAATIAATHTDLKFEELGDLVIPQDFNQVDILLRTSKNDQLKSDLMKLLSMIVFTLANQVGTIVSKEDEKLFDTLLDGYGLKLSDNIRVSYKLAEENKNSSVITLHRGLGPDSKNKQTLQFIPSNGYLFKIGKREPFVLEEHNIPYSATRGQYQPADFAKGGKIYEAIDWGFEEELLT